eukprot:1153303-Pelagomonas_calceolata.AAC.2
MVHEYAQDPKSEVMLPLNLHVSVQMLLSLKLPVHVRDSAASKSSKSLREGCLPACMVCERTTAPDPEERMPVYVNNHCSTQICLSLREGCHSLSGYVSVGAQAPKYEGGLPASLHGM